MSIINPKDIILFSDNAKEALNDAMILFEKISDEQKTMPNEFEITRNIKQEENHYYKITFNKSGKANFYIKTTGNNQPMLYIFDNDGLRITSKTYSSENKKLVYGVDVLEGCSYLVGVKSLVLDEDCDYIFRAKLYDSVVSYNKMIKNFNAKCAVNSDYKFVAYGERSLQSSKKGTDVVKLQRNLIKMGYKVNTTGVADFTTISAVKEFQKNNYIDVDASVGKITRKVMEYRLEQQKKLLAGAGMSFVVDIHKGYGNNNCILRVKDNSGNIIVSDNSYKLHNSENIDTSIKLDEYSKEILNINKIEKEENIATVNRIVPWVYDEFSIRGLVVEDKQHKCYKSGSLPVRPRYINKNNKRYGQIYNFIAYQFNVEYNARYRKTNGKTYCNIFAWDVSIAMDAEIPHWVRNDNEEIYHYDLKKSYSQNAQSARELNANSLFKWMEKHHEEIGYKKVSDLEAQNAANAGKPTFTLWYNKKGGSGHIQVVLADENNSIYNEDKGVFISQAGSVNYRAVYLRDVYSKTFQEQLVYYTCK